MASAHHSTERLVFQKGSVVADYLSPVAGVQTFRVVPSSCGEIEILHLEVDNQGRGVGRAAVAEFFHWAAASDYHQARADSVRGAVDFWEKQGFSHTGHMNGRLRVMTADLERPTAEAIFDHGFDAWHDGSKAVSNGEPLVLYHGTGAMFDAFADNQDGAHYFSTSPAVAAWFAQNADKGWVDDWDPRVISACLAIKNPKRITRTELAEMIGDADDPTGIDWTSMPNVVDLAQAAGHDGIHLVDILEYDGSVADQWLAFRADQIRIRIAPPGFGITQAMPAPAPVPAPKPMRPKP